MTPLTIREVQPAEFEVLGELLVEAYGSISGALPDPEYDEILRDVAGRSKRASVLVAIDEVGHIRGGVTYAPGDSALVKLAREGDAEVRMLAVAATSQRKGIGRSLVAFCIERARSEARQRIWLATSPWMSTARGLYEALGFRRVQEFDYVETSADGTRWDCEAYALELGD